MGISRIYIGVSLNIVQAKMTRFLVRMLNGAKTTKWA